MFVKTDIASTIREGLATLKSNGLLRKRRVIEGPQGPEVKIDGKDVINFCSNDYLGLASHPAVLRAFKSGIDQMGAGSGASQLVCGYSAAHKLLEKKLAEFTGRQRAIVFSSGYMANLAIANALAGKSDIVFCDRLSHASMIDAALMSRARLKRFSHCDPGALDQALEMNAANRQLVLTEGVFSMDGDIAPLTEYADSCSRHDACLVVDDAHGFGVLGMTGAGTLEHFRLTPPQVPLLMATFGKALGTFGAFIAGDNEIMEYLMQKARTLIYTTALPPALMVATLESLSLLEEEKWRREKLAGLIRHFRRGASQAGLSISGSVTPIQPLIIGGAEATLDLSERLLKKGIYIQAIRPPTVPAGTSRLRITITAGHEKKHLDYLLECLQSLK